MHELVLASQDAADTRALAAALAADLHDGDVVALTGELGAGKTVFVQGAATALGVTARVTSPTFLLRHSYPGDVDVVHLDVYRLDALDDVVDLGVEQLFDERFVTFVEWGDAVRPLLPPHLEVELGLDVEDLSAPPVTDVDGVPDEPRRVVVRASDDAWARRLDHLAESLAPWRVQSVAGAPDRGGA